MENITILIVDDETRMRKLIKDFLVKKDYKTIEAEDGEVALELFEQNKNKINLILLNLFYALLPQHFLYFFPEPHGHGSFG